MQHPSFRPLLAALVLGTVSLAAGGRAEARGPCGDSHRIQTGETLKSIAKRCEVPSEALQGANPQIDWRNPRPGDVASLDFRVEGPRRGGDRSSNYVVKRGDTLATVAGALGITLGELLLANPGLSERDLQAGRSIEYGGRRPGFDTPPPPRLDISVDDSDAEPGGTAVVRVSGLPPRVTVSVQAESARGRGPALENEAQADRRGNALVQIDIPQRARPGDRWNVEVFDDRDRSIGDASFRIADEGYAGNEPLRVTGVLTDEGAACPVLRDRSGQAYALSGRLRGFRIGDRVTVVGRLADGSVCARRNTLAVDRIDPAR